MLNFSNLYKNEGFLKRFYILTRIMLGLCGAILAIAGLKQFLTPQLVYNQDDRHITVTYSHLWTKGCVDVIWTTNHIEAIFVETAGVGGEGRQTFCDTSYGPLVTVHLAGGARVNYNRAMLWQSIETYLWIAILCVSIAVFCPRRLSLLIVSSLTLVGIALWLQSESPSLPVSIVLPLFKADMNLGRVLVLAALVPPLYWIVVPSIFRIVFLLGVGLLTFVAQDIAIEYLILLGVLIVWVFALGARSNPVVRLSTFYVILCGILIVLFAVGVVLLTSSGFSELLAPTFMQFFLYLLLLGALGVWGLQMYQSASWPSFFKGIVITSVVLYLFHVNLIADAADIAVLSSSFIFLIVTALLLGSTAFWIGPNLSEIQRPLFINGGIVFFIGLFIVFKLPYASVSGWIGFSYIAFRLLHVLLELRQKTALPALTIAQFGLYATFFSTQQVGPITLLPLFGSQLQEKLDFSWNDYGEGWQRILWGSIKKFFIADALLSVIIPGTVPLEFVTTGIAWLQIYAYAIYLYFDFSGFVDIALGLARLVGYRLPENFDNPYLKGSLAQFWQSWHMTLSHWIRSYVYLPLSRALLRTRLRRSSLIIVFIANFVTMVMIGVWHGFALRFIFWGVWHAIGLFIHKVFSDQTRRRQIKWRGTWKADVSHVFSVLLTFHFVVLG